MIIWRKIVWSICHYVFFHEQMWLQENYIVAHNCILINISYDAHWNDPLHNTSKQLYIQTKSFIREQFINLISQEILCFLVFFSVHVFTSWIVNVLCTYRRTSTIYLGLHKSDKFDRFEGSKLHNVRIDILKQPWI
jgi:hypothetical protein